MEQTVNGGLSGRVALVTGGTGGIGLGAAQALAAEGCIVVALGSRAESVAVFNARHGTEERVSAVICDVADRVAVVAVVDAILRRHGKIDILVHAAGINVPQRAMDQLDPADFDRILSVNTTGTFNVVHAVLPSMRARGAGDIFNIASVSVRKTFPLAGVAYTAAKAGAAAMGTFLGVEEAPHGVRVTTIYPGEVNTPLIDKRPVVPSPEQRAAMLQPEDIAACVVAIAQLPARAVVTELVITPSYMT